MEISLTDLEQAINFWRNRYPSTGKEQRLCSQANALAAPYAEMIMSKRRQIDEAELPADARTALGDWRLLTAAAPPAASAKP
ncbi:DUF3717 domain-containing protein [Pigmentiphaga soli]|uniref:DUF3717 domain-containing protein n=1 Tax=Pigmentiphaga soli TaxID=1007095 RepID=A0ABP8H0Z1_9BURK